MSEGWVETPISPGNLTLLGLPGATSAHRKLVSDGVLVALASKTEHGWTLVVSHIYAGIDSILPGRMPTILELREARETFIPYDWVHMVALLEPPTKAILERLQRSDSTRSDTIAAPGLPTSVRCVQMHVEGVTDDVVFGTESA